METQHLFKSLQVLQSLQTLMTAVPEVSSIRNTLGFRNRWVKSNFTHGSGKTFSSTNSVDTLIVSPVVRLQKTLKRIYDYKRIIRFAI